MLLKLPRFCSTSSVPVVMRIDDFHDMQTNKAAFLISKRRANTNSILNTLAEKHDAPILTNADPRTEHISLRFKISGSFISLKTVTLKTAVPKTRKTLKQNRIIIRESVKVISMYLLVILTRGSVREDRNITTK